MPSKPHLLPRGTSMVDRLHRLFEMFHGDDRVLVVINADPDAIASAMALKRMLWRRVTSVTVVRTNVIKRPDNLALVRYLKKPLQHINEVCVRDFKRLAMVDSQPHHMEQLSKYRFDVVIDHHPLGQSEVGLLDVRPDYGATSTIMTEYLRAAKINPSRNLATALFYGIKTDTNNFARQGQVEDMKAFRFLFPKINQSMLQKIENSEFGRATLKQFQKAMEKVKISKNRAFVFLGKVDTPDLLVQVADFFMRIHDIDRSVAAGIFKDRLVIILRMVGDRTNAGKFAEKAFGRYGSAGGHKAMARAELPMENLDPRIQGKEASLERFVISRLTEAKKKK